MNIEEALVAELKKNGWRTGLLVMKNVKTEQFEELPVNEDGLISELVPDKPRGASLRGWLVRGWMPEQICLNHDVPCVPISPELASACRESAS